MKDALNVPPTGLYAVGLLSAFGGPSNFAVAPGECLGIFGPRGSGKTMLLRMVAGLEPSLGEIWVDGVARSATEPDAWCEIVIYVPTIMGPDISERNSTHLPPTHAPREQIASKSSIFHALDAQISAGTPREDAAPQANGATPRILLLDDPCLEIDADSTNRIENYIAKWRRLGLSIIVVSRDPAWITRIADRTCSIVDGSLSHQCHAREASSQKAGKPLS